MQPDRQIELRHGGEDWLEGFVVQWTARHIGEDLNTAGMEVFDCALCLLHRALDVRHRKRGDEGREARGMALTQLGHGVVSDEREVNAGLAGGKVFDRRIWQRNDLPGVAELVHLAEPL